METYLGILTDKDINQLHEQGFNPYNQTRIDRYIMRYYLNNGQNKVYYHCFEPSPYGIEILNNQTQTNKGENEMNELQKRLQALKAKKNDTNEIKKGIIQQSTDLTLQKFTALENLQKRFDTFEMVLSKQSEKCNQIYMDNATTQKQIKAIMDLQAENNQLLVNIANSLSKIQSVQTVKIKDTKKEEEREHINIETSNIDYQRFYSLFMDCLQSDKPKDKPDRKFAGSDKKDKINAFTDMVKSINFNDIDTLPDQLQEYSKTVNIGGFFLYGRPIKDEIISALRKAWNKLNNNTSNNTIPIKENGTVYSKKYFLNFYKAQEADFDAIIDMIKENGFDNDMESIIADYLSNPENNLVNWEDETTYDKLINWFKGFSK